jgi:hypothetical protein
MPGSFEDLDGDLVVPARLLDGGAAVGVERGERRGREERLACALRPLLAFSRRDGPWKRRCWRPRPCRPHEARRPAAGPPSSWRGAFLGESRDDGADEESGRDVKTQAAPTRGTGRGRGHRAVRTLGTARRRGRGLEHAPRGALRHAGSPKQRACRRSAPKSRVVWRPRRARGCKVRSAPRRSPCNLQCAVRSPRGTEQDEGRRGSSAVEGKRKKISTPPRCHSR